jgi:hypothetical protein
METFSIRRKTMKKPNKLNKLNEQTDQIQQVKYGLPKEAFAIATDPYASETWLLPHHTLKPGLAQAGQDVDWNAMADSVALLAGIHGNRVAAPPEIVIEAARHLAKHYENAKKPVPDALGALS